MVFADLQSPLDASQFERLCGEEGVRVDHATPARVRLVTHRGVTADDIEYAIAAIRRVLQNQASSELRPTGTYRR